VREEREEKIRTPIEIMINENNKRMDEYINTKEKEVKQYIERMK